MKLKLNYSNKVSYLVFRKRMTSSRIHHLYMYICDKRKTRENVSPFQKEMGDPVTQVTQDMEKAEVLNKGMQ